MSDATGWQTETVWLDVSRVQGLLERRPRSKKRLFSDTERRYCDSRKRNPYQHYAARLAAKLAARRLSGGRLSDFEVNRDDLGAPTLSCRTGRDGIAPHFMLSLSHEGERAIAIVAWLPNHEA